MDPDIFDVANPTFYVHQTQIDSYCTLPEQDPNLIKPIHYPPDYRLLESAEDKKPNWMNSVGKPVVEFLSNVDEGCLYAQVPEEIIIELSEPEIKSLD